MNIMWYFQYFMCMYNMENDFNLNSIEELHCILDMQYEAAHTIHQDRCCAQIHLTGSVVAIDLLSGPHK